MSRHHIDVVKCRRQVGISVGMVCNKCDGQCPECNSLTHSTEEVRICDECNYGTQTGRCIICGGKGVSSAYYCRECVLMEHSRNGCSKNLDTGSGKADFIYDRKKLKFRQNSD